MKNVILLSLFFITLGCKNTSTQTTTEVVSVEEFSNEIQDKEVQLLDVRTAEEFAEGHIQNAINIDVLQEENFKENIQELDKSKPIFVYCRSGKRSANAAKILKENGFDKIYDLEGGYGAWKSAQ